MLDFLKEIVEPVPDPSAGGTINLGAEENNGGGEQKKRRAPKGKKPAGGEEEEEDLPPTRQKRKRKRKKDVDTEDVAMGGNDGADEDEE